MPSSWWPDQGDLRIAFWETRPLILPPKKTENITYVSASCLLGQVLPQAFHPVRSKAQLQLSEI